MLQNFPFFVLESLAFRQSIWAAFLAIVWTRSAQEARRACAAWHRVCALSRLTFFFILISFGFATLNGLSNRGYIPSYGIPFLKLLCVCARVLSLFLNDVRHPWYNQIEVLHFLILLNSFFLLYSVDFRWIFEKQFFFKI